MQNQPQIMDSLPPCLAPLVFHHMSPYHLWTTIRKINKHWRSTIEKNFHNDEKSFQILLRFDSDVIRIAKRNKQEQSVQFRIQVLGDRDKLTIDWIRPIRGCTFYPKTGENGQFPEHQQTRNVISIPSSADRVSKVVKNLWNGQATLSAWPLRNDSIRHVQGPSNSDWVLTITIKYWQTLINADCERCFNLSRNYKQPHQLPWCKWCNHAETNENGCSDKCKKYLTVVDQLDEITSDEEFSDSPIQLDMRISSS
jgi:hypothetical protein